MKKFLVLLVLLVNVAIATAEVVTVGSGGGGAGGGQTSDDFIVSWSLTPEKSCYDPGDKVTLHYTIKLTSDEAAKRIDGRTYTFRTALDNPAISAVVYYNGCFVGYKSTHGKILWADVEGIKPRAFLRIVNNVNVIPEMLVSPKEFETDIYQGSTSKFGIVIEETSGLAMLKNVRLSVNIFYINVDTSMTNFIPPEWISFDKNNFDVPAGGKVTVSCKIKIPKDAKPGKYVGTIVVSSENGGRDFIHLTINVLKDIIPPEIVVYSPKDGAIVFEPYVTVKGVVRDNIGIKSLKINKEELIRVYPATVGIEKEEKTEVPFEQEIQLKKGWNYITIEAEDFAGNRASKTISVKYVEFELIPITPTPIIKDIKIIKITTPPPITSNSTLKVTLKPRLKDLSVSIHPKYVEAKPGDTIIYTVTIDWYPPEWRGDLNFHVVISAAGFKKEFKIQSSVRPETDPPITNQIPVPIPKNILPLTYKVKLIVEADGLKASDETELRVTPETPGFGVAAAIIAGAAAMALRRMF